MFLDRVKIFVKAGAGGDGAATFRTEAHVPRGGPDGGDGGRGGSIHLRVDAGQTTLRDFRQKRHFKATPGGRGGGSRRHGAAGDDLTIDVPPGTAVFDDATGELLADLVAIGQTTMIGRGGRGGLGNTHFKTSTHQAPKHAQKGEPGEERRPTIADVPGLIEGASLGAGLGHAFLRHVERTRVLLHLVDGSGRDPAWDHDVIRDELRAHDPALLEKPILTVFNKLDQPAAIEAWPAFRAARRKAGEDVVAISAVDGTGLDDLRARIADLLPSADEMGAPPDPAGVVVHRIEAMGDGFSVEVEEDGGFRVRGKRIERVAAQTNFDVEESAERFQRDLGRLGIDDELRRQGIRPGDPVRIGAVELEWEAQPWEGV